MTAFEIFSIIGSLSWLPQVGQVIKSEIQKPKLTILPHRELELCYSSFGQILNIKIAFLAEKKKVLIKTINLTLIHPEIDSLYFTWDWIEEVISESNFSETYSPIYTKKSQKAIALIVEPNTIIERKIGFQQNSFKNKKRELSESILKDTLYLINTEKDLSELKNYDSYKDLIAYYNESFKWLAGEYTAIFDVETYNGQLFTETIKFKLTDSHLTLLKANLIVSEFSMQDEFIIQNKDDHHKMSFQWVNLVSEEPNTIQHFNQR